MSAMLITYIDVQIGQKDRILKYKMYAKVTETATPAIESINGNMGNSMKVDTIIAQ